MLRIPSMKSAGSQTARFIFATPGMMAETASDFVNKTGWMRISSHRA